MNKPLLTVALSAAAFVSCSTGGSDVLSGEWQLAEIKQTATRLVRPDAGTFVAPADEAPTPYLGFEGERVWGYNGCNQLTGSASTSGGTVDFSKLASTLRACPGDTERYFMAALGAARQWKVSGDELSLLSAEGQPLARFVRLTLTPQRLEGEWEVVKMQPEGKAELSIEPGERTPFIGFKLESETADSTQAVLRLYGSTGCNRIMGQADYAELADGRIAFGHVGATRMYCPDATYEADFLSTLDQVAQAKLAGETLTLSDKKGNALLTLRRR